MKILLVEDSVEVAHSTTRFLELRGYEVVWCSGSTQAYHTGVEGIDAVISDYDLGLGSDNGCYVLAACKRSRPEVPTCMMSGLDRECRWADTFILKGMAGITDLFTWLGSL